MSKERYDAALRFFCRGDGMIRVRKNKRSHEFVELKAMGLHIGDPCAYCGKEKILVKTGEAHQKWKAGTWETLCQAVEVFYGAWAPGEMREHVESWIRQTDKETYAFRKAHPGAYY